MSFLKRLWRLGGCSRLQGEAVLPLEDGDEEAEAAGAGDHCFECLEAGHVLTDLHYVPWTSPGISRRLMARVRDSPKLARRMMTRMTSPGQARRRRRQQQEEAIYIVSVNVVHSSGHNNNTNNNRRDAWTSMGEDVRDWAEEENSDTSSSGDSEDGDEEEEEEESDSEGDEWQQFV